MYNSKLNGNPVDRRDELWERLQHSPELLLCKDFYFHDIQVTCQTNHPAIMTILNTMLDIFPEPATPRGYTSFTVICHDQESDFPVQLPQQRRRLDTVRLLTGTKLKHYSSLDRAIEFQSYVPLPVVNEAALSMIDIARHKAVIQITSPEKYQAGFLRRYVFLLALGRLMQPYGLHPCHAAAISAPGNTQSGALILGDSGSGKTTLSLGCAIAGCGLLGDDLVMLREDDTNNSVNAYSISDEISVRSNSLTLWPELSFLQQFPADQRDKRYCSIEQIRPGATQRQTSIRLLLFPTLTGAEENSITRLSRATLFQELIDQCVSKKNMPVHIQEQVFSLLGKLVEQAEGYRIAIARGSSNGPELVRALFAEATL